MPEYDFTLKFQLPDSNLDSEIYLDQLYEHGCDDALIGIGQPGYIALNFIREAISASDALDSAIQNVLSAIPNAVFINASPDLVGITDIAHLLGCSRQNVRKLLLQYNSFAPPPVYQGAQSIWHLASVLAWLVEHKAYSIDRHLMEIARANMVLNLAQQRQTLPSDINEVFLHQTKT